MNSDEPLSETGYAPNRNLWYHSTLNRDDCDRILSQHGPGSYLVRKSDHSESYRLSVVDPDKVRFQQDFCLELYPYIFLANKSLHD